jgi:hypothetical protein
MHTDSQSLKAEDQVAFLSLSFLLKSLIPYVYHLFNVTKGKTIPVTGRGGP